MDQIEETIRNYEREIKGLNEKLALAEQSTADANAISQAAAKEVVAAREQIAELEAENDLIVSASVRGITLMAELKKEIAQLKEKCIRKAKQYSTGKKILKDQIIQKDERWAQLKADFGGRYMGVGVTLKELMEALES